MHRWVRFKLDAGRRVRDFCRQRAAGSRAAERWADELDRLVTHAEQLELDAIDAMNAGLAATSRRAQLRHLIRASYLRPVLGILDAAALKEPGSVTRWPFPVFRADDHTFASTVRAAAAEAKRVQELMHRNGLRPEVVDEMLSLLAEWDACGRRQDESRQRRAGASAGLEATTNQILGIIRLLDALFRLEHRGQPALRAEWQATRHIPWPHRGSLPVAG